MMQLTNYLKVIIIKQKMIYQLTNPLKVVIVKQKIMILYKVYH